MASWFPIARLRGKAQEEYGSLGYMLVKVFTFVLPAPMLLTLLLSLLLSTPIVQDTVYVLEVIRSIIDLKKPVPGWLAILFKVTRVDLKHLKGPTEWLCNRGAQHWEGKSSPFWAASHSVRRVSGTGMAVNICLALPCQHRTLQCQLLVLFCRWFLAMAMQCWGRLTLAIHARENLPSSTSPKIHSSNWLLSYIKLSLMCC